MLYRIRRMKQMTIQITLCKWCESLKAACDQDHFAFYNMRFKQRTEYLEMLSLQY